MLLAGIGAGESMSRYFFVLGVVLAAAAWGPVASTAGDHCRGGHHHCAGCAPGGQGHHGRCPSCASAAPASPKVEVPGADARVGIGKQLFAEMNPRCTVCHSLEGKGNPKGPLDDVGSRFEAEGIKQWLRTPSEMAKKHGRDRKPAMVPYPELTDEELDALAAYLVTLKKA